MPEPIKTLEELEEIKRKNPPQYYPPEPFRRVWHGDLDRLIATARAYLDPWKQVEDELPPDRCLVIALKEELFTYMAYYREDTKQWYHAIYDDREIGDVTHWCPIPPL